ncbi:uncharacterized protein LOC130050192 [Ostrea edulis]|uniref:uncharacterized protein LOC130050192 n=1 Tax=Ostrea edulis TaxID=37623 RepID=UPI0024AFA838|nr:uncharacterized protein LOC130050192 [Ostrea edulis]
MVLTTDIFLKEDILQLLRNKFIVIIGDSNQRAIYKDLVLLLQKNDFISGRQLRTKGEFCFENDTLIEGGRKSHMNNGKGYREVRQYQTDCHLLRFYFVTRCYSTYVESILSDLSGELQPDVVIMNSCLWDISRYGSNGVDEYKENLTTLFDRFKQCLSEDTLVIWNTTLPIAKDIRGGFLVPEVDFMKKTLRLDILEANFFAKQVVAAHGFDIVDLHYHLRHCLDRRADDGVHWDKRAHRHMTNLLLTHITDAWREKMPGRVKSKAYVNGNCQPTETVSNVSLSSESTTMIQKTTSLKANVNLNSRNIQKENVDGVRTCANTCRPSNGNSNLNRPRRSADPAKPFTMGEKEQLEIFSTSDVSNHVCRRRSYNKLQADLNKVQKEILGMVSTPPSSKGQYTKPALRETIPYSNSCQNSQHHTDNYYTYGQNYVNNLTRDLYQTQYQHSTYSQSCDQGFNNNYNNNLVNNYNNFQWQPYAQDNYQRTNHAWSSRTHYRHNPQNQNYYRMSHNY